MQQPQGASIWGNINTCVEIALNVYYIYAEHGEGIVIGKEKAEQTISAKAVEAGNEDGEYLYYGKDNTMGKIIPWIFLFMKYCKRDWNSAAA